MNTRKRVACPRCGSRGPRRDCPLCDGTQTTTWQPGAVMAWSPSHLTGALLTPDELVAVSVAASVESEAKHAT